MAPQKRTAKKAQPIPDDVTGEDKGVEISEEEQQEETDKYTRLTPNCTLLPLSHQL
jgi:hypothetical protein